MINNKAVVLLSGGLDSATTLAVALKEGYLVKPVTFAYGQRHHIEIQSAVMTARSQGAGDPLIIRISDEIFQGTALAGAVKEEVAKDGVTEGSNGIPLTYVPARNLLFLAYGISYGESIGAHAVYIGANSVDYSGYPDCRGEFLESFEKTAALGTRCGVEGKPVRIMAPLLNLTKSDIIRLGIQLGVDYSLTHSCYDPDEQGLACGHCDSCIIRKRGFLQAGVPDPTRYVKVS